MPSSALWILQKLRNSSAAAEISTSEIAICAARIECPSRLRRAPARQANAALTREHPAGPAPLVVHVGPKRAGQVLVDVKR